MASKCNVSTELINVSPEQAEEWLKSNEYEHQRALKKRFANEYARDIVKGNFKLYTTIEFAYLNGHTFLMDGQHRLSAITKAGINLPLCIMHRHYNNIEDIAFDYARTDYGRIRTFADVINALHAALGIKERLVLTNREFNYLSSAFGLIYRGFMKDGVKADRPTLYEKTLEWQYYAREYFDIVGHSNDDIANALRRQNITAMALCTLRFSDYHLPDNKSAIDFWRQVRYDDGTGMYDPRKKLREILIKSRIRSSAQLLKNRSNKELLLYTIRAWEAYCNNEDIQRIVLPRKPIINILHTPFDTSKTISEYKESFEKSNWGENWPST